MPQSVILFLIRILFLTGIFIGLPKIIYYFSKNRIPFIPRFLFFCFISVPAVIAHRFTVRIEFTKPCIRKKQYDFVISC